jgi:hypothetical protein
VLGTAGPEVGSSVARRKPVSKLDRKPCEEPELSPGGREAAGARVGEFANWGFMPAGCQKGDR